MTLDKSLKVRAGLARQRSVLKRVERLEKLKESDRWSEGASVFGLPKVRVQKLVLKKKKKEKVVETEEGQEAPAAGEDQS
ncbi:MAG: small basic protein [Planctomycetaceae bacterium]|nr:small basic protein [Planctomycetaceae bacterium]|tara:strand:- start:2390 stop:2629 length:240 start_codon:yes stop_codon:yes gene_type:complete